MILLICAGIKNKFWSTTPQEQHEIEYRWNTPKKKKNQTERILLANLLEEYLQQRRRSFQRTSERWTSGIQTIHGWIRKCESQWFDKTFFVKYRVPVILYKSIYFVDRTLHWRHKKMRCVWEAFFLTLIFQIWCVARGSLGQARFTYIDVQIYEQLTLNRWPWDCFLVSKKCEDQNYCNVILHR